MDSQRWERIQNLFHGAADLSAPEQQDFLKSACGEDHALLSEVSAMLEEDARGASLLDRDMAQVAHQTFAEAPVSLSGMRDFGPYRIQKLLGEGGMGVVYLAERSDLGSLVAIKLLRDAWLSPARRERFTSEQRTLAQLNHPSIARLYDADTLGDGTPWFVMEYVEGVPLTAYCDRHKCSVKERLRLFRSVCEAVQYAHQLAVIHRDLKPSNILVKEDGTVRLLDFGIAKQLETLDAGADQTRTALRLMTLAYAAPEQIRGDRIGIHTDVYSLGVILYQLLAGELPFDLSERTPAEAENIIVQRDPEKPSAVAQFRAEAAEGSPTLTVSNAAWADLDVLCLTAMHKDPERRYRTVDALVRDVDHYLNAEPLEARPDSLRYRVGKFVKRNRGAVTATALVVAIVVGMGIFFTVRLARARNAALAEAARTQRIQHFMTNLFQGGDEAAGPADALRVSTLLDRGVQEAQSLNNDPKVQAELYQNLGEIYQKLGKFDRADPLLTSALEQRQKLFGPDTPEAAESLVALGLLRDDQAKLEEAEKLVRQGLDVDKRHLPPGHPATARATSALGKVLVDRGQFDQAIQVLDETVKLQSAPGVAPADLAASLSSLADAHYLDGHYKVADGLYRRVLDMHRQLYGDRHPLVADDLGNLGGVQQDLGYYTEAEKFYRQSLDINQSYYGTDNPRVATSMNTLGRSLLFQNRFDEATGLFQQALAIRERVYGPVHPSVATSLNELGSVALQRDHNGEAEAYFIRMRDIYRQIYGDHHYLIALAQSNLASVYVNEKDYARAEPLFRDAVRRYSESLSPDNLNVGIAHIKLGRTLLREKRYSEAEVETLAGYNVLIKQSNPATTFVHAARTDLAAEYDALNEPEKAAKYRAELAEADAKAANTTTRK
jgi:serine/threonine-protein kinase